MRLKVFSTLSLVAVLGAACGPASTPPPPTAPAATPTLAATITPPPPPTATTRPTSTPTPVPPTFSGTCAGACQPVDFTVYGASFLSPQLGWAVGAGGKIARWDGQAWQAATSPTQNDLYAVLAVKEDQVWAVGQGGQIVGWNGRAWAVTRAAQPNRPSGMSYITQDFYGLTAWENTVWAFGNQGAEGGGPLLWQLQGTRWVDVTAREGAEGGWQTAVATGPTTVLASGGLYGLYDLTATNAAENPLTGRAAHWLVTRNQAGQLALASNDYTSNGLQAKAVWQQNGSAWQDLAVPRTSLGAADLLPLNGTFWLLTDDSGYGWQGNGYANPQRTELWHHDGTIWHSVLLPVGSPVIQLMDLNGQAHALTNRGELLALAAVPAEQAASVRPTLQAAATQAVRQARATQNAQATAQMRQTWGYQACPSADYLSRLAAGERAYVNPAQAGSNRVRNQAGRTGTTVLGNITPNTVFQVIGGPRCVEGWVWWEIRTLDGALTGWTAEGNETERWLLPCPLNGNCP